MQKKIDHLSVDLHHKVALVTGASSGLGREFCLSLVRHGCHVIAVARRTQLLETLLQEIASFQQSYRDGTLPSAPGEAAVLQMDVSADEPEVDAAVENAWQVFGQIDVLVNNAGFRGSVKSPLDLDSDEWNKVMATNLRGLWYVSKAVGKRMRATKTSGSIINISSTASLERGLLTGAVAYATSKAAVNHLTKVMALELGKYNIRVNAIAAGIFKSEMTDGLLKKAWVHEVAQKMVPMQRWGVVNPDLTSLVLLLASDTSPYLSGTIIVVDGGHSISGVPLWSSL